VQELLQVLGFLAGGLMMFLALRRIEACEPCGRYARTRPLLRRVSTIRLDDLLRRAGLVLPNLADAVRAAVGARRLIALNLRMAECPGCRRHWLRPEAIVAGGAQATTSALPSYDIEPAQAAALGQLAAQV
jgi:hypothetical protein